MLRIESEEPPLRDQMIPAGCYIVSRLDRAPIEGGACAFLFRVSRLHSLYRSCIDSPPPFTPFVVVGRPVDSPFCTRQTFLLLDRQLSAVIRILISSKYNGRHDATGTSQKLEREIELDVSLSNLIFVYRNFVKKFPPRSYSRVSYSSLLYR